MDQQPLRTLFFEDLSVGMTERLAKTIGVVRRHRLNFRAPVKIGDTVVVTVTVVELMPEKSRARLSCLCEVDGEPVLDGEALVKVPSGQPAKGKRPVARL
jgi:3-hydroxybutyryl-CoA dehydratase